MIVIEFSSRQKKIIQIVQENEPITSEQIANMLNLTRATLRPDLAVLTMTGILEARPKVGYFYSGNKESIELLNRIYEIKVGEIKSVPVVVDEKTSVYDAIVSMFLEDVGTVFVISDGYLAGVVSRKDFLKTAIGGTDINKVPVGIIMTRMPNIVTVKPTETVLEAAKKIIEHEVDSLPIVEEKIIDDKEYLKVVGRISKTNITKLFIELANK
ncbi:CBS domain-containing protein [Caminicella sporogenes DSM 14501]|uniref:CBS domain-containing protein n=1 Tax=Caminicella sporogenes DSM 14501 TaxID=1121266 RepID=A0A1M6MAV9_9FIRM|nr:helix-turn-helix transcriptional regulator [Caminicella sporogenes]RKD27626.1 transcriptional regulator [Caminicella sporogenes]WIF94786.1 helix-turn-helix transcriptional regulator [Caminicella sporogenes]SHJ80576.1 CBS domain-containing protein [Caminicella sporogenes DSM 14501]